jgi:hypothetical protein
VAREQVQAVRMGEAEQQALGMATRGSLEAWAEHCMWGLEWVTARHSELGSTGTS